MKILKNITILIFTVLFIYACQTLPKGEEEILQDATPPAGYNPIFIQGLKPFDPNSSSKPAIIMSGLDTRSPNNIKARFHIVGDNKYQLTGANDPMFKNIWCVVADSFNGKEKQIKNYKIKEVKESEQNPVALALVADHSGSMGDWRAEAVQNAFFELINKKKPEDAIAIVKYDGKVITEVPLTTNKDELMTRFQRTKLQGYGGMTAISNSILSGIEELKRASPDNPRAVVVFTDGWDNSSTVPKDSVIRLANLYKINIFAIDFGANINKGYMVSFADATGGYYHHIYNTDEFSLVFDDIYKRLKNAYILEYNPSEYGVHKLKLRLCLQKDTIQTETTYDNTPDLGSIGLLNIYFDFDKAIIKKESDEALNAIYTLMKGFPGMMIEIRGHTDSMNGTKDPNYNVKLSQKRADAIRQALVKLGIQDSRIESKGYGETIPVADNTSEEGRALNRRTEFVVMKK